MVISRTRFYGLLVGSSIALCGLYQVIWLFSHVTAGEIRGFGHGAGRGYRSVQNTTIAYSDGTQEYTESYLRNGISDTATTLEIYAISFSGRLFPARTPGQETGVVPCSFSSSHS